MKIKIPAFILILTLLMILPWSVMAAKHKVVKGENLSKISQRYYGSMTYWRELQRYNSIANANLIYPGDMLTIPGSDVMRAMKNAKTLADKQKIASQAKANGGKMPANTNKPKPANPGGNTGGTSPGSTAGGKLPLKPTTPENPRGANFDALKGLDTDI